MHLSNSLLSIVAITAPLASASPLLSARDGCDRETVAHKEVQQFEEKTQPGRPGELSLRFKPQLWVKNGCVPFPAVDDKGRVSGGLKAKGPMDGDCTSSVGQVYARDKDYGDQYAIMYAWYFPKDQNINGDGGKGAHRHDWENVIVWLTSKAEAKIKGISYSGHGGYDKITGRIDKNWDGDSPKVGYGSTVTNHQTFMTDEAGGKQPLISWDSGSGFDAARDTLNCYVWNNGKANVPFNDANFEDNLNKGML